MTTPGAEDEAASTHTCETHLTDAGLLGEKKHAGTESETVVNRSRFARLFACPCQHVPKNGSAYMYAHFKLGVAGMLSPRMHYLDDTGGTGVVYIGYIGKRP